MLVGVSPEYKSIFIYSTKPNRSSLLNTLEPSALSLSASFLEPSNKLLALLLFSGRALDYLNLFKTPFIIIPRAINIGANGESIEPIAGTRCQQRTQIASQRIQPAIVVVRI